jgi:FkbM family methyltransferase
MFKEIREGVKKLPVVGPLLYKLYLTAFFREGQDLTIRGGPLKGMKFRRFMHTFQSDYVDGNYEPELQQVFSSLIKPGQVVYDVGANVGFMTLLASKLVGPTGTVVAFEPRSETARNLRAQISINQLDNVIVEECAVAEQVGTSEFVVDSFSVMSKLADRGAGNGSTPGTQLVRTTTLDHVIGRLKPPDLVKIDIEGAELLALSGASRLLSEHRPILVVELHSEDLSRGFHALMDRSNYEVTLSTGEKAKPGSFSRFVVAHPPPN